MPEDRLIGALLALAVVLRLVYAFHFRVDSDEPQHLHVAWGWTRGLVQYRDVFDNHAPLFHLLIAPLLRAFGERPDILILMRIAMLPLYLASLLGVYAIGRRLYGRRTAAWAAVFAAFAPGFFLASVEFRADDLWATLWIATLAVAVSGRLTSARCFAVGMLFGATLAVSLKTTMLLTSFAAGAIAALVLAPAPADGPRRLVARGVAALLGVTVVPGILVAFFAAHGALAPLYAETVAHNVLPGLGLWHKMPWRAALVPASIAPIVLAARDVARAAPTASVGARRVLIVVSTCTFFVLLFGVWPLITREDFIPTSPLVALVLAPHVLALARAASRLPETTRALRLAVLPLAVVAAEVAYAMPGHPPWKNEMRPQTALVSSVLELTAPDDYVMDPKGETIFRRRPYFWVLEHITQARLDRGLLVDSIPEDLVATRTAVVLEDRPNFPPRARAFMDAHYLPVGSAVRVLGQMLPPEDAGSTIRFEVVVPARYVIVAADGSVGGTLDGLPYDGARTLAPGTHEYRPDRAAPLAVEWANAAEHGFSPFRGERASS